MARSQFALICGLVFVLLSVSVATTKEYNDYVNEEDDNSENEEQYQDTDDSSAAVTALQRDDAANSESEQQQEPNQQGDASSVQFVQQGPSQQQPTHPLPAPVQQAESAEVHVKTAAQAAKAAKQAAKVANNVAAHAVNVTHHAKKALKHALGALHDARVGTQGLNKNQRKSLKKAEARLKKATAAADHGELKQTSEKNAADLKKEAMQKQLDKTKAPSERDQMRKEIETLRQKLKEKKIDDKDTNEALDELEKEVDGGSGPVSDESKAELERLRQLIDSLDGAPDDTATTTAAPVPASIKEDDSSLKPLPDTDEAPPTPVRASSMDIDTEMPYGDLEPFGREDTAQELTEQSITESDGMVDQLERAEVAEEKRAVFRALTRLRGAAITSFDGIARSQTGNIDEYNKIHKWRTSHPLHHLADEESDVSKWAFPDNAD